LIKYANFFFNLIGLQLTIFTGGITMTEEQQEKKSDASAGEAWEEVGQRFQSLGESLAAAFKSTWENEETQAQWEKVKVDVDAAVNDIGRAAQEAAATEEAQKAKAEAYKTAEAAQQAGQEAMDEVKPHLLAAFRKIRTELDKAIEGMENSKPEEAKSDQTTQE
jgi:hypothetical protein